MLQTIKWVIGWFFAAFSLSIPELIRRVLSFLGVGLITVTGINYAEQLLIDKFVSQLSGLPMVTLQFLGMFRIDDAFSLIVSAFAVKKLMTGWSSTGGGRRQTYTYNKGGTDADPWSTPSNPSQGSF